ncbi:cactin homolog, putative [Plasmodium knowlesi strain H]|uniref:Splicing factor Cactin n=3 Tax=Plasmodium knowlesi TaxID=5850 RepID=A0A5K1VGX6_PLAKH|nr:uncharacterized protein PKNH_0115000 [Plasmodium knowlesi strain H]OTN68701.1 putative Cactin-like protein [Plasmodium knowlesi]CAA9986231.1 cactin homolog, putative [Plasmodium knowlesi strain H]SBO25442.1 cactin homolog, putative [Plasmodium knowlesi strain H]SBO27721.1 cactin homolog, putative [Plasmodium knowlesi strain H]VVS75705.1 cactin homolog, putative [Plasmodium knowlesi strain H]|eukprot:XP_002257640.1 [Plasmodium knowlesi strain H]
MGRGPLGRETQPTRMSDSSDGEDSSGGKTHKDDECRKEKRRRKREKRSTSRGRHARRKVYSSSSASSDDSSVTRSVRSRTESAHSSESPDSVSSSPPRERRRGKRRRRHSCRDSSRSSQSRDNSDSSRSGRSGRSRRSSRWEERGREKAKRRKARRKEKSGKSSRRRKSKHEKTVLSSPPSKNTLTVKELKKERENLMQKHFNYTDECNPFGDNSLSTPFVWKLKNKYDQIKYNHKVKVTTTSLLQNSLSKISEIEEVKKRRQERDNERAMLEDYRLQLEKQRNQVNIQDYLKKEQLFFIDQQIKSSDSRIERNFLQLPDIFRLAAMVVNREQVKKVRPALYRIPFHVLLEGQTEGELENCAKQIKLLLQHDELNNGGKFRRYWNSLLFFCGYFLDQMREKEEPTKDEKAFDQNNLQSKTDKQIHTFLENKNYDELVTYEEKIKEKVVSQSEDHADEVYWNRVLVKIPYFKAKNVLLHFHAKLRKRISMSGVHSEDSDSHSENHSQSQAEKVPHLEHPIEEDQGRGKGTTIVPYECHSPKLIHPESITQMGIPPEMHIYTPEEELEERLKINDGIWHTIRKGGQGKSDENGGKSGDNITQSDFNISAEKALLMKIFTKDQEVYNRFVQREKKKGRSGEITMKDVSHHHHGTAKSSLSNSLRSSLPMPPDTLLATRKPLYFNRIKTSFDWNKYNKTHYDYENPPPKYICGYKFNIFYMNLLNKKEKPSWKLHPMDDESKVLIVFHGGAPYLDIAFQIVNAEWSYDKHRGFRNVFDKGILQLYFNFKKKRYRR